MVLLFATIETNAWALKGLVMAAQTAPEGTRFIPSQPAESLPTMYDLPSEDPEEPGLPDEFHYYQPQLLRETFLSPVYLEKNAFIGTDINLYYDSNNKMDRLHAAHLKNLKKLSLREYDRGGHDLVKALKRSGELHDIVLSSISRTSI